MVNSGVHNTNVNLNHCESDVILLFPACSDLIDKPCGACPHHSVFVGSVVCIQGVLCGAD